MEGGGQAGTSLAGSWRTCVALVGLQLRVGTGRVGAIKG